MAQKRPSTRQVSNTRRRERTRGPSADPVQRIIDETARGGSTMNLASGQFAHTTEQHDPTKPEHFILGGEKSPVTGQRYPTESVRMPGYMLSSAQWEDMSPQTRAMKPMTAQVVSNRLARLHADRAATGTQSEPNAAMGTWRVPRRDDDTGVLHPRYGQVDFDVSAAMTDKLAADQLAGDRGEEAVFGTNPMRNIPTVVGHLLGMAYHPMDVDLKAAHEAEHASRGA
jgi:hypothetical protein